MPYIFVVFLCIAHAGMSFASGINPRAFNYAKADRVALSFTDHSDNTQVIADKLTRGLATEHEKFRALFMWVTHNISYSYGQRSTNPEQVLRTRQAVCSGYSMLLKELCTLSGIECKAISGYAKSYEERDIGVFTAPNHAWNAVRLYGQWFLVDATWAAGYMDGNRFVKKFDEFYFLTDPAVFIYRHFPEKPEWKLTKTSLTLEEFGRLPIYLDPFFKQGIRELKHLGGELEEQASYSFRSAVPITSAHFMFEEEQDPLQLKVSQKDGIYHVAIPLEKPLSGPCYLFLNGECVLGFIRNEPVQFSSAAPGTRHRETPGS